MNRRERNLSELERTLSGLLGLTLTCLALRERSAPGVRALAGVVGAGLLIRAATGRCAVKAALLAERARPETIAEPPVVSPRASTHTTRLDDALEGSFPASDPLASQLPDEPPSNAEEKWAAANASAKGPSKS
jgi:Inner membrane protein YgaP-like, transmembrane domain